MSTVTRIEYTFHADACGDDATAGAFEAWAQGELERRYPSATIRVRASDRTSGEEPPVYVEFDEDDEDAIVAEVRELWSDWERANWPAEAAAAPMTIALDKGEVFLIRCALFAEIESSLDAERAAGIPGAFAANTDALRALLDRLPACNP